MNALKDGGNIDDRDRLTAYLLGELAEQDQLALEREYFVDDSVYQQLIVIEDELAYDYVENRLSADRRGQFEKTIGATERGRRNVELAQSILAALRASQVPSRSYHAAGIAAAVLLAISSAWLAFRVAQVTGEIEQLQNRASAPAKPPPLEVAFVLSTARSRAEGGIERLEVPPDAESIRLEFIAPAGIATSNEDVIAIRTNDTDLWSQKALLSGPNWVLRAPARLFPPADYEVVVRRLTKDKPAADLIHYSFRLFRK